MFVYFATLHVSTTEPMKPGWAEDRLASFDSELEPDLHLSFVTHRITILVSKPPATIAYCTVLALQTAS